MFPFADARMSSSFAEAQLNHAASTRAASYTATIRAFAPVEDDDER